MGEEIKDVNAKVDQLEEAAKKYASKDTVISIGGYEFTPAKLMVAFTLVSSILGGLYGVFETYKDWKVAFGAYNTGRPVVNQYALDVYNYKIASR